MDLKFTSHMEEELDQIEDRKVKPRRRARRSSTSRSSQSLKVAETKMHGRGGEVPAIAASRWSSASARLGKFFGCSGYPECKYIKRRGRERSAREPPVPTEHMCPDVRQADGSAHGLAEGRSWVAAAIPSARPP